MAQLCFVRSLLSYEEGGPGSGRERDKLRRGLEVMEMKDRRTKNIFLRERSFR